MPRVIRVFAVVVFSLIALAARGASAEQKLPTLRVVSDSATVRTRPALLGDVVSKVKAGTMLEAIDLEDGWYWVVLPADEQGTRFPGWIREHDVEIAAAGDPSSVLRHFSEAVQQAKDRMEAEAAEQEARLERAREKVEEARRQYDAAVQRKDGAAAPASDAKPPAPAESQKGPVRLPRADTPHADMPREYQWFAGYSFYRDQSDSLSYPAGWALAVSRHLTPTIDLTTSISGSHRSDDLLGVNLASATMYTFAAGPKYARRTGRVTSFAQVLAGVAIIHTSVLAASDLSLGFALQPGFGVDIPVTKTLAARVGFDIQTVRSGGWFTGFRIDTGVIFVTGSPR